MSDAGLLLFAVFVYGLIALFWFMRLNTTIDAHEISIHYVPFVKKKFKWSSVKSAQVVNYGFVGGWGIRLWTAHGTVYNTSGNMGLAITLHNGKKILVGTQRAAALDKLVTAIKAKHSID